MNDRFSEIELRKIDLNLLLVFSALMRERGVGRASQRLFLGPSAVSMALNRLRETFADPLFVRAGSGMEPTPRAVALWDALEPALAAVEQAVRGQRDFDPARATQIMRVALPDDLEFLLVPRLLELLSNEAPGMRLVVRPSDYRTLLGRLDDGDADLALSATPTSGIERRHRIQPLYREEFAIIYDANQVGRAGPLDLDAYLEIPHLLLSIRGDLRGPIDDGLAEIGRSRQVIAAVSHFPTIPYILKRRRALANVPAIAARHFAAFHGLEVCAPPFPAQAFEVSLSWHVRVNADPAHHWLRERIAALVAEIRDEAATPQP